MNIMEARLCVQCGEIHEQSRCPVCTEEKYVWMKNTPMVHGARWQGVVAAARVKGKKPIEIVAMSQG